MTKETKIGLLVGMGVIILIGILISDHLSVAQRQQQAQLANGIPEIHEDMIPPPPPVTRELTVAQATQRVDRLPTPEDIAPANARKVDPTPAAPPLREPEQPAHRIFQGLETVAPNAQITPLPPAGPAYGPGAPVIGSPPRVIPADPGLGSQFIEVPPQSPVRINVPQPQPPVQKAIVHYVGKEETLSDISRKYYQTAGDWKAIYEANRSVIPNPNLLRPGVRLVIPPKPGTPSAAMAQQPVDSGTSIRIVAERPAKPTTAAPATKSYTVQSGDTLSSIADKFTGSANNWQKIYAANKGSIKDPNRLSQGTVLQIPAN